MIDTKELGRTKRLNMFRIRKDAREGLLECVETWRPRKPSEISEAEQALGDDQEPILWAFSLENKRSGNVAGRVTLMHLENYCEQVALSEATWGQPNFRLATGLEVAQERSRQNLLLDERISGARHLSRGSDSRFGKQGDR